MIFASSGAEVPAILPVNWSPPKLPPPLRVIWLTGKQVPVLAVRILIEWWLALKQLFVLTADAIADFVVVTAAVAAKWRYDRRVKAVRHLRFRTQKPVPERPCDRHSSPLPLPAAHKESQNAIHNIKFNFIFQLVTLYKNERAFDCYDITDGNDDIKKINIMR